MARAVAVAVDGAHASASALEHASWLARRDGAVLHGIFVLDTGWRDFLGNDWQSSAGSRQAFLDYVRRELGKQAAAAQRQFEETTAGLAGAVFHVLAGDPVDELAAWMALGEADTLVAGRSVFQVCGRPSLKSLARDLPRKVRQPVVLL